MRKKRPATMQEVRAVMHAMQRRKTDHPRKPWVLTEADRRFLRTIKVKAE